MAVEEKVPQTDQMDNVSYEGKETTSLAVMMKDPAFRSKIYRWLCIPIGTFTLGIIDSEVGPTLHDLEIITSTDTKTASLFFTASSLGYMIGSFLSGFLYGKVNSYFMMLVASVLAGAATIASPYCSTFAVMSVARCLVGFFRGIILCTSNTEHLRSWGTSGEALLQLIHAVYAVGGVLGPLISSPFLTEKVTNETLSHQNVTTFNNHTQAANSTLPETTNVHYAYLIGGIIIIISGIPFFIVMLNPDTTTQTKEKAVTEENSDRKLHLGLKIFLLTIMFLFFFAYCCVEITFSSYLATFVVDQYKEVNRQRGAYISTFFWAPFAAARFLAIVTSKYIAAIKLIYVHLSLVSVAFSGFLVSAVYSRIDALTAFTCVIGLACSATFPAAISWVEAEIMTVSGPVSSVILIGGSIGAIISPFVVGYLMEEVSNLWFCYIIMISLVIALLLFVFLLTFNRLYVDKKYGKKSGAVVLEKKINSPDDCKDSPL